MASKIYGAIALTGGGTGSLDAIDGALLANLDMGFAVVGGMHYIYWLDDDSGATENSPYVISPDANAGTKRWLLTDTPAVKSITQASHGFAAGDVLYLNGTTYTKAKADAEATAEVVGMVSSVIGANDFVISNSGLISGLTGLTAGTPYYLSAATAGALTATEPTTVGHISKPVFIANSTTSGFFFNMRGVVIGASYDAASEILSGIAEIATQAEVNAGTDDARIVTPAKLLATPMLNRKNAIINGDMRISQRGTTFGVSTGDLFTLDRFSYKTIMGTGAGTISQEADAPSGLGLRYSLKMDVTTAVASPAAEDGWAIRYVVEGYDFFRFVGQTAVFSFHVKSTKTGIHSVVLRNSAGDCGRIAEYTVNVTNTWEKKTIPVTFDYTTGTWNYTNGIGLILMFSLGVGATYAKAPGDVWDSAYVGWGSTNQVNCMDNTANNFFITGVQLELGSVATPFEFRPYAMELALCQRYCLKFGGQTAYEPLGVGFCATTAQGRILIQFPVEMRAAPTFVTTSSGNWMIRHTSDTTAQQVILGYSTTRSADIIVNVEGTPLTAGGGAFVRANNTTDASITLTAEI